MGILDTGIRNAKNVRNYMFGPGSIQSLPKLLQAPRQNRDQRVGFFIDEFFKNNASILNNLAIESGDHVVFVPTEKEPTTDQIDSYLSAIREKNLNISAIVGMGGGITLDVAKAVANLLTNPGKAADYQGWDLVKNPAVYKIGIPTISGTGAEATRTCVMTNTKTGVKLGMNSDFTVYDQIILDSDLTSTVSRDQYFWTGMDTYVHCIEALAGSYRNAIGDAFSREAVNLCQQVFLSEDMMTSEAREKLMVASYLGGCAIATSYVGVVHPFSAGLSVVLGLHHCVSNCIVMRAVEEFYPEPYAEFWKMVEKQNIHIPEGVCRGLKDEEFDRLYASTIVHEKPLTNALGPNFGKILTREKVKETFLKM